MEEWRSYLYYPLGLLPSLFFTLRFLIQWIRSEKEGRSTVTALFWKFSITGNLLLLTHYFIQGQVPFALLQMGNAVIAWRNLNLMQSESRSFSFTIGVLSVSFLSLSFCFAIQSYWLDQVDWIRVPQSHFQRQDPGWGWHAVGILGQALFACRFWVQWWQAEQSQKSELGRAFWWLSLAGSLISVVYFLQIRDVISILNQAFGIIPYARNLMLIRKTETAQ